MRPPFSTSFQFCLARNLTLVIFIAIAIGGINAHAQTLSMTDGSTPAGAAPGAPVGSDALSDIESINLYNGNLNFHVPIFAVGGRGTAQMAMMLAIENRWSVKVEGITPPGQSHPTWVFSPQLNSWTTTRPGYGPGVLVGRQAGEIDESSNCGDQYNHYSDYYIALTRFTFILADGTEYELRDAAPNVNGKPLGLGGYPCYRQGSNRGKVFVTADGSAATFISDQDILDKPDTRGSGRIYPHGYLMLRDGSRYRIENGLIKLVRDRNGNQLTFHYDPFGKVQQIVDSLGRQMDVEYDVADVEPYGLCDRIRFKGFNGVERIVRVSKRYLHDALRAGYTTRTSHQLFPSSNPGTTVDPIVTSSLWLPNGQRYRFYYNDYVELARVELPTGGTVEYDHQGLASGSGFWLNYPDDGNSFIYRGISERRISSNGNSWEGKRQYLFDATDPYNAEATSIVTVNELDLNDSLVKRHVHSFHGSAFVSMANTKATEYSHWKSGKEYKTEVNDLITDAPLTVTTREWQQRAPVDWWRAANPTLPLYREPGNDPRLVEITTKLFSGNLVKKQRFIYDSYNNQTDIYDHSYGIGVPSVYILRHTHTDYLIVNPHNGIDYTSPDIHLRNLPTSIIVRSVGDITNESVAAATEFRYDEPTLSPITYDTVAGWADPGTAARGNVTTKRVWLNTTGGPAAVYPNGTFLETHARYDQCGNTRFAWDAQGQESSVSFNDAFADGVNRNTYAFPTQINTPAVPDPSQPNATLTLTTSSVYDFSTGLVTLATDANGRTSAFGYDDPLDRLKQVVPPAGGAPITYEYGDSPGSINVRKLTAQNENQTLEDMEYMDGLGRPSRSFHYRGNSSYETVDIQYDAAGRVWRQSNPYLSSGPAALINPSGAWTTKIYDDLGRQKRVTSADTSQMNTTYGVDNDWELFFSTVTDARGRARRFLMDSLGRTVRVDEPDSGNGDLGPSESPVQMTNYNYDVLGNLIRVDHPFQERSFVYDSLGRLLSATNPENGKIDFRYDSNGNVTQRTDARGITTTYQYDALNRIKARTYSDSTPGVTYSYDSPNVQNAKGRLVSVSSSGTSYSYDEYDDLGRVKSVTQSVGGQTYSIGYTYDLAGHVLKQTYPSNHEVNYTYDEAGRTQSFSGTLGDNAPRVYSTDIIYSPFGGLAKEKFGTDVPIYNKLFYNSRGQLAEIRDGTTYTGPSDTSWNRGAIINFYSTCWGACAGLPMPDNNGNLVRQENWIPTEDQPQPSTFDIQIQQFEYDWLNRVKRVHQGTDWQQQYTYDSNGNRLIDQNNTWGSGIPKPNFGIDPNTNRMTAPAGSTMSYDASGNLINDTYSGPGQRSYDGANRMVQAGNNNYVYDGDGRRVKRIINGQETWQIYGIGGGLIAEYAANTPASSPQKEYGYRNGELLITTDFNSDPSPTPGPTPSTTLVVSQVYGGGGNSGANYRNDFIELYNRGTTTIDLSNWSVQYAAATSNSWQVTPLSGSLAPGHYYLVQEAQGAGGITGLPTPDAIGSIDINATTGKVALVNGVAPVNQGGPINDLIGYGTTANQFEGSAPAGSASNTAAAQRAANGCVDLNDNASDFTSGGPNPRNTSTATNTCSGSSGSTGIVISEFRTRGPNGGNDELIELYNRSSASIDISGWKIKASNSSGAIGTRVTISANTQVPAYGHFLLTNVNTSLGYSGTVIGNQTYTLGVSDDGGIAVTNASDTMIDQIGLSNGSAFKENRILQTLTTNIDRGYERKPGGGNGSSQDTNDNVSDFAIRTPSTPQNLQSPPQPPPNIQPDVSVTNPAHNSGFISGNSIEIDAEASDSDGTISKVEFFAGTNLLGEDTAAPFTYSWTNAPIGTHLLTVKATDNLNAETVSIGVSIQVQSATPPVRVHWLVSDQLGTPRMIFDQSGSFNKVSRHDYLPFGEELFAGTGGRTPDMGYGLPDSVRMHFTSKERDTETGLDYFGARYYSNLAGRFTSADSPFMDQDVSDPQSWNLYSYVRNKPLGFVDPFGLWHVRSADGDDVIYEADLGDNDLSGLAELIGVPLQSLINFYGSKVAGSVKPGLLLVFSQKAWNHFAGNVQQSTAQNTSAIEGPPTAEQGNVVWNALELARKAMEARPLCRKYAGAGAYQGMRAQWDSGRYRYFHGIQGGSNRSPAFAETVSGGLRTHTVLFYGFFNVNHHGNGATFLGVSPVEFQATILIHEVRHYLCPGCKYAEAHDANTWNQDIVKYCFK